MMMDLGPKPGTEVEPITIGSTTYMLELRHDSSPVVWTMAGTTLLPTDPETSAYVLTYVMERCISLGVPSDQTLSQFHGVPIYVRPEGDPEEGVEGAVEPSDLNLSPLNHRRAEALFAVLRRGEAEGWAHHTAEGYVCSKSQREVAAILVLEHPHAFGDGNHTATLYRLTKALPEGMVIWNG